MVDWSKISAGLADRIKDIITGQGEDKETAKLDKHAEYQKLSQLLSGDGKVSGEEKSFVEGMLKDYEEKYMVRPEVRERVLDIIKHGEKMQADDKAEFAELKKYAGTDGLTKEEKKWIKDVINGRIVKDAETATAEAKNNAVAEENNNEPVEKDTKEPATGTVETKPEEKPDNNVDPNPDKPVDTEPKTEPKPVPINKKPIPPTLGPVIQPVPVPIAVGPAPRVVDNDRVDDKDHVDNKGATQQGGMGNINVDHGTVIINNGIPVPVGPNDGGHGEAIPNPDAPVNNDDTVKSETGKIPVEDAKKARDKGEIVGDALLGHTSNTEQRTIQDIVNEEVNSGNILDFLKGYEKELKEHNLWAGGFAHGDHFFEQMRTENNFPEQQDLMRKVAEDLQGYLANKYGTESDVTREIAIVLLEGVLGKEQAKVLDEIYQKELGVQNKSRPMTSAVNLGVETIRNLIE